MLTLNNSKIFSYLTICILYLYLVILNTSLKTTGQKLHGREHKLHQLIEFRQKRQISGPFLRSKSAIELFIVLQVCFSDLWYLR